MEKPFQPLESADIVKLLPHRYPFLLVDRVIACDGEKTITAIKNVTSNEPFFQGHFPGRPIMPGVLILEALAQTGGILARLKAPSGQLAVFMAIDKAKFRRQVIPGDQLRFEVELKRFGGRVVTACGKAWVGDQLAAEGDFMFGMMSEGAKTR